MTKEEIISPEEAKSWRQKAIDAAEILRKISQPPLVYATVLGVEEETVDIATTNGQTYVVSFNPKLRGKFKLGQTVRLTPETMAVIDIAGNVKTRSATVVKDLLSGGRVKIEHQGLERVIESAVPVKVGDAVLVDNSYSVIVESLGTSSQAYKIDKVPEIPWNTIGGLEKTIEEIRDAIEMPFLHKEVYSRFPNKKPAQGVLLYGPPGCGKTMLGKGIAYNLARLRKEKDGGELNGYFLYVAGPEFLQRFVGTGEAKVREIFAMARETASEKGDPVVIFVDEPESVLKKRGTGISSDATDVQRIYSRAARETYYGQDATINQVIDLWDDTLEKLDNNQQALIGCVDWITKKALIDRYAKKNSLSIADHRLQNINLQYHDIDREVGIFYHLQQQGKIERMVTDKEIAHAVDNPPRTTRALFRGTLLKEQTGKRGKERRFAVADWTGITVYEDYKDDTGSLRSRNLKTYCLNDPRETYENLLPQALKLLKEGTA